MDIQRRILDFKQIAPDDQGECHGKCAIIEELEDALADERVLDFFLKVIADKSEYDLARIATLKILQLWQPPNLAVQERIGVSLAEMLVTEKDILVQQWAAIAAESFVEVPQVFDAVSRLLADADADLDVRHNCFAAIERLRGSTAAVNVLRALRSDEQLGRYARDTLAEWDPLR